ncbi:MAG: tRNA lysidine(34) synthetase TilS [Sedimenticolaceae bacterium]
MSSRDKQSSGTLDPDSLLEEFNRRLPHPEGYRVGFSGGLDSTVLLNVMASLCGRLPAPLSAIHVDHSLQPGSRDWAGHCRSECERLGVPLTSLVVDAAPGPGESPEAAARAARYAAIAKTLGPRSMFLTAHHLDDQAETLLLQLLRGAGVNGLAAMPVVREWNAGWHARPLLKLRRAALRAWALANGLRWIEDPSNARSEADRNYLRHHIMPGLASRWPGAVENIARSAAHCADAADTIRIQAEKDLGRASSADRLRVDMLRGLSAARARNLLRHWLGERGAPPLSLRRLSDALDQLCHARSDAAVRIAWKGVEMRRFRDQVWLLPAHGRAVKPQTLDWVGEEMRLGPGLGRVRRRKGPGGIDPGRWVRGRVSIAYRHTGLRCRPAGRNGTRSFKKIAQDFGIPPWQREILPVVFIDGEPAAIANCCACEPFAPEGQEPGWLIEWDPD